MPRDLDLSKHTIHLRAGDYAYLSTLCATRAIPTAQLVRSIIAKFVDASKAKEKPADLGDLE